MKNRLIFGFIFALLLTGSTGRLLTRPLVYSALIVQQGTSAPEVSELYQDDFEVTLTGVREAAGYYSLNFSDAIFTIGKTRLMGTIASDGVFHPFSVELLHHDEDTVQIIMADDGALSDDWGLYLEIKVYP